MPAGEYDLVSPDLTLKSGTLRTTDLTLTARDGRVTRLSNADVSERNVRADAVQLGRVQATGVQVTPNLLVAQRARVSLCRDPRATGLTLDAQGVTATPTGTHLQSGTLQAGGLRLPASGTFPVRASGPTVAATVQTLQADADALINRVQASPPQFIVGADAVGIRNVPLLDAGDTRFSVVYHSTFPEVNFTRTMYGASVRAGVFNDDGNPLPEFSVARRPPTGFVGLLALRGNLYLTEARAGYAGTLGPVAWIGEVGAGHQLEEVTQNKVTTLVLGEATFAHAQASVGRTLTLIPGVSVGGTLIADGLAFSSGERQGAVEAQVRGTATEGAFSVTLAHTARFVAGTSPFKALRSSNLQTSVLDARFAPPSAEPIRLDAISAHAKYNWLTSTWEEATATVGARLESADGALAPRVSYDAVARAVTVGTDALLYSDCFAYGLALDYTFPNTPATPAQQTRGTFKASLKFNFR
ncbi:hypothetical protein [Deinococcus maricopensis]|uniref:Uncharacterized protein n=1 Tax=Deinococcus maricopensis (strain DSM 21211 / LMG 22137 / NRRL B-23946 / LB-34) TaxID=709986 RepID=E8U8E2_DEIML|nr:hypothetical protein [Deinococcus maricopensis]ADV67331.1 hypothetical protein Deima_1682 [Deinococcus maricopensis DSM 21211]